MKCRRLKLISLKLLVILITCICLLIYIYIFKTMDFSTKYYNILRNHIKIDTFSANKYREAKQVEKIAESNEVSKTSIQQSYIHFRDLFNKTYSTHILTGPDNVQDKSRYFIYRCETKAKEHCGGWADRVKGMLTAYLIANLTGRVFKAEVILPSCDIRQFIVPNHVNWSLPEPIHKVINESNDVQILNYMNNPKFRYKVDTINFLTLPVMKAKYVYFKTNMDSMEEFQTSKFHQKQLSWMQNLTKDQIVTELFKYLFKLNPRLQSKVDGFLAKNIRPADKLICAHVRTGRNPTLPRDSEVRIKETDFYKIYDFLLKISNKNDSKIFIMTDSEHFKAGIIKQSFREKLIFTEGNIVHIELSQKITNEERCAGLEKVILDQFILMHCDTLLISKSGLGRVAAYIRGSDQDLYCLFPGARIVPCERRKIKDLYHAFELTENSI